MGESVGLSDELQRLEELRRTGVLDESEFAAAKARLLVPARSPLFKTLRKRKWLVPAVAGVLLAAGLTTYLVGPESGNPGGTSAADPSAFGTDSGVSAADCQMNADAMLDSDMPNADVDRSLREMGCGDWLDQAREGFTPTPGPEEEDIDFSGVKLVDSGWSRVQDTDVATWGAEIVNPTSGSPVVTVVAESLDEQGVIRETVSEEFTLAVNSTTQVGGVASLVGAKELRIAVTVTNEDLPFEAQAQVTGEVSGEFIDADLRLTITSDAPLQDWCDLYVTFRDASNTIVGGADVDDHPPVGPGTPATFRPSVMGEVQVPAGATTVVGTLDESSC